MITLASADAWTGVLILATALLGLAALVVAGREVFRSGRVRERAHEEPTHAAAAPADSGTERQDD